MRIDLIEVLSEVEPSRERLRRSATSALQHVHDTRTQHQNDAVTFTLHTDVQTTVAECTPNWRQINQNFQETHMKL